RKRLQLDFKRVDDRMEFVPPARWVWWTFREAPLEPATGTGRPPTAESDKPKGEPDKAGKRTEERENPLFHVRFTDSGTVVGEEPGKLIDKLDQRLAVMEQERDELRKQIATLREELRRGKEKTAQAPAGQETGKSEDRIEAVRGLQRELAELKAKERDRRIYVDFLIRRVRSLRPPAEQDETDGIEAERRRERFRAMRIAPHHNGPAP